MSSKRVAIGLKPGASRSVDEWVGAQTAPTATVAAAPVSLKRLTIDIPEELHRRLKIKAAEEGVRMADLVRDWIEAGCGTGRG